MRRVSKIVVHCSDSDHSQHDNWRSIDQWHRKRGWDGIGYNYFVNKMGHLHICRPIGRIPAHVKGHNKTSVGICLSGKNNFTDMQFVTLRKLCLNLMTIFSIKGENLFGHYELDIKKTCPNFDMDEFRKYLKE